MIATLPRNLRMIDGMSPDWVAEVEEEIELGHNFILMLPNRRDAIAEFCKIFELGRDCRPEVLTRHALISMSLYMDQKDFDYLFEAEDRGDKVLFIEQLDLAMTRPPRVKQYLVYSPTWGIVSQHDQLGEAREGYYDYVNSLMGLRPHLEAGVYKWTGEKWEILLIR